MRNDSQRAKEAAAVVQLTSENELLREKVKAMKYQLSAMAHGAISPGHSDRRTNSRLSEHKMAIASPIVVAEHPVRQVQSASTVRIQPAPVDKRPMASSGNVKPEEPLGFQKSDVLDKIDLISARRMMRHMRNENLLLNNRLQHSETIVQKFKTNNEQMATELAERAVQLDQLRQKFSEDPDFDQKMAAETKIASLNEQLAGLRRENQALKEANDRLIENQFAATKSVDWHSIEQELLSRLHNLEQQLHKATGQLQLAQIERNTAIRAARRKSQKFRFGVDQQVQAVQSAVPAKTAGEKKQSKIPRSPLLSVDEPLKSAAADIAGIFNRHKGKFESLLENETLMDEVNRLRKMYREVYDELEKVRNLLLAQYEINQSYAAEVKLLQSQLKQQREDFELTLADYVGQIRQLKSSDTVGTVVDRSKSTAGRLKSFDFYRSGAVIGTSDVTLKLAKLEMGSLAEKAVNVFLSVEFFNFEMVTTPIAKGPSCVLDFQAIYEVEVSDLFVHYLQNDTISIDLFEVHGTSYTLLATGKISLVDFLLSAKRKNDLLAGKSILKGIKKAENFAELEYEISISQPLTDRLLKHREIIPTREIPTNTNELNVHLKKCCNIDKIIKEKKSPKKSVFYIVYEIFDQFPHPTGDLEIAPETKIDDRFPWQLTLGPNLQHYLTTLSAQFVLFEEWTGNDGSIQCAAIGRIRVPLVQLAAGEIIDNEFSVFEEDGTLTEATLSLSLEWKNPYEAPVALSSFTMKEIKPSEILQHPKPKKGVAMPEKVAVVEEAIQSSPEQPSVFKTASRKVTKLVRGQKVFEVQPVPDFLDKEPELSTIPFETGKPAELPEIRPLTAAASSTNESEKEKFSSLGISSSSSTSSSSSVETTLVKPIDEQPDAQVEAVQQPNVVDQPPPIRPIREKELAALRSVLPPIVPVPAPRRPKAVEFSEPLHESIPPSEDTSEGSNNDRQDPADESIGTTMEDEEEDEEEEEMDQKSEEPAEPSQSLHLRIGKLQVLERSPLADPQYAKMKLFVEWKLLDIPAELCETPDSLPRPKPGPEYAGDFAFSFDYALKKRQIALLIQWAHHGSKLEFTLVSDPGDDGECDDLGVAQVDLLSVMHEPEQVITFFDVDGIALADLDITIRPSPALAAVVNQESRI